MGWGDGRPRRGGGGVGVPQEGALQGLRLAALRRGDRGEHGLDAIERAIRVVDGEGLLVHAVVADPQQVVGQIPFAPIELGAAEDVPAIEHDLEDRLHVGGGPRLGSPLAAFVDGLLIFSLPMRSVRALEAALDERGQSLQQYIEAAHHVFAWVAAELGVRMHSVFPLQSLPPTSSDALSHPYVRGALDTAA